MKDDDDLKIHRTYRLRRSTIRWLDAIAARNQIGQSALADLAIRHVLAAVEAGDLVLDVRPTGYTATGVRKRA